MLRRALIAAAATIAFVIPALAQYIRGAPPPPPPGVERTEVGTLSCNIAGGIGLIIASRKEVACTFFPAPPPPGQPLPPGARVGPFGPEDVYVGAITKFGLDVGITGGGQMVWSVLAPTIGWYAGALAGTYAGASAEASIAAGLGANALVGGSNRTFALQPLSIQAQTGLNLAIGVAELQLVPAVPVR